MPSDSPDHARASASPQGSRSPSPTELGVLVLRALVTPEIATIITGRDYEDITDFCEQTGVEGSLSKALRGVHDRILTISGSIESVAKTYALIVEARPDSPTASTSSTAHTSIRLLIPRRRVRTIIGRNGIKINAIQDSSGAHIAASRENLPGSTERVVDVQGSPEAIGLAIEEIGICLLENWERDLDTVLYTPGATDERPSRRRYGRGYPKHRPKKGKKGPHPGDAKKLAKKRAANPPPPTATLPTAREPINLCTQNISIPSEMVGCIIGRGGTKTTEIRRLSGSKISVAKAPHDETGERMFTIVDTSEANEKALSLICDQLESEKERRVGKEHQNQEEESQD